VRHALEGRRGDAGHIRPCHRESGYLTIFRDRDGRILHTLVLEVLGGQIQAIRGVINPDKLGHLGPVADAWAIDREMKQARRQST
jgi:hypothetical protein